MDDNGIFDEAVGRLEPSTVDVDEVIRRGRRSVALRRVASPVAGVAAAVVLLVVSTTILPAAGRSNGIAAPPSTTTSATTSMTTSTPSGTSPPPSEASSSSETSSSPGSTRPTGSSAPPASPCADAAAETRQRFTVAVHELIDGRMSSGWNLMSSPAARDNAGTAYGPLEFFQLTTPGGTEPCDDRNDYLARANAEVTGLVGSITVKVSRSSLPIEPCPKNLGRDVFSCEMSTGPNGEQILSRTVRADGDTGRNVTWVNKDGVSVEVTSSTGADPGTQGDPEGLPIPPLDSELQVEIALDSRITLP